VTTGSTPARRHDAVTFDFWNTCCVADAATTGSLRVDAWAAVAHERAIPVGRELLAGVLAIAAERHHEGWLANEPFDADDALLVAGEILGPALGPGDLEALRAAWLDSARGRDIAMVEGLPDVLAALADAGIAIGVVCDVGLTPSVVLREYLADHGVLGHFGHLAFSDEVGVHKPHPAIFRAALDGLGVADPRRALHVGDLVRTDIAGARALGMTAVRFRGVADDPDAADPAAVAADAVIDRLVDLVGIALGSGLDAAG
jgi:putative hydrolase of the HAD superfamily